MLKNEPIIIMCSKCNKRIDELDVQYDVIKDHYICTARCHGDYEKTTISVLDIGKIMNTGGVAFNGTNR